MRHLLVGLAALILVLGLACGGAAPIPTPTPIAPTPSPTATPTPKADVKGAPEALKGVQEAMAKIKSSKARGTYTITVSGTPVPGMPTGPQTYTAEFSDQNSHIAMGAYEIINVDKVIYVKANKDAPWQKLPAAPPGGPQQESPSEQIAKLVDVASAGTEPCPQGGLCQVITAALPLQPGDKASVKMWVGAIDGLIYKYQVTVTSKQTTTEMSLEIYDYNVPVTITAPIP